MKYYVLIEKYRERKCSDCKNTFPATLEFFHKTKSKPLFLRYDCKTCSTEKSKKYNNSHRKERNEYDKEYRAINREATLERKLEWYYNNKTRANKVTIEARKRRRHTDGFYKFTVKIRNLIKRSIKNKNFIKNSRTHEILGCTFEEFKIHIESLFLPWMTWDNYGLYNNQFEFGWDFDHIIPVDSAITEEEVILLNHYTNFQPLCSKINRDIKRNKSPEEFSKFLLENYPELCIMEN